MINVILKSAKETGRFWSGLENKNKIGSITLFTSRIMVDKEIWGFPGGSVVKNLPDDAGDMDSTPGSRRSPGEGNGNPLQYSYLENPMGRGAWQAAVHGSRRVGHD